MSISVPHRSIGSLGLVVVALLLVLAACASPAPPASGGQSSGASSAGAPTPASPGAPASTGAAPTAAPKTGGTLHISTDGDWVTFDPATYNNITDREMLYPIYDSLLAMDENLNVVPELARTWQESSDGLTWTFTLAKGVKFQDGTDFNAQAVKFNLDRILNPETQSRLRQELTDIKEVQVVDDYTFKVVLNQPFTPLLGWFAEVPGMMSSPTAIQKWGKDYGKHPVGAGPFELVEQVKSDHATFKRFKDYWQQGLPYVDQIEYKPIADPTARLAGLKSGVLEVIDAIPADQIGPLKSSGSAKIYQLTGSRWPMIRLNFKKGPLANKSVRQALSLAIDRDAIVKAIYSGNAAPAYGPIAPVYKAVYDPAVEQYGFKRDVQAAKQKLAEGGQPNGFSLALDVQGTSDQVRLGELLKAQLADIGVNVEITSFDVNTVTDRLKKGEFQASVGSWTLRPDVDGAVYRHFRSGTAFNYLGYQNPQVDQLLDKTRSLPPGDDRVKAFRDVQKLIVDDAPWIFLVWENQAFASSNAVSGLPLIPDALVRPRTASLNK